MEGKFESVSEGRCLRLNLDNIFTYFLSEAMDDERALRQDQLVPARGEWVGVLPVEEPKDLET